MKQKLLLIFGLISINFSQAQVIITEVYYDAPYLEDIHYYGKNGMSIPNPFFHHVGEFIELYNYSTEDIPLKNWSIADKVTKYQFPDNAVIHAGEFIVVTYRPSGINFPFPACFPTTIGKESQIFYQDKIILNNYREALKLMAGFIRGIDCKKKVIQSLTWSEAIDDLEDVNSYYAYENSQILIHRNSFHLQNIINPNNFNFEIPTPLDGNYIPPTQNMEDIVTAQEALADQIVNLTWEYYSSNLINNLCDETIPIIEQTPMETYLPNGKCFVDNLGNNISPIDCNPTPIVAVVDTNYTQEELNDFEKDISIAPNPSYGAATAHLTGEIVGKVTSVQITGLNGIIAQDTAITSTQTSVFFYMYTLAAQLYIARFTLNTGQSITKYVIKL